jgi:hypothetical protein
MFLGAAVSLMVWPPSIWAAVKPGEHVWDEGGSHPYQHDPRRPLLEHHIKWGEEVDNFLLQEIDSGRYSYELVKDGMTFDGMYFGNDEPWVGTVIAIPSKWKAASPRSMHTFFYEGLDGEGEYLSASYSVPIVCGNPSWKIHKGNQPPCIPRPVVPRRKPTRLV